MSRSIIQTESRKGYAALGVASVKKQLSDNKSHSVEKKLNNLLKLFLKHKQIKKRIKHVRML